MSGHSLLAPVPKAHIDAASHVLSANDFVCFGSDSFDAFATLDLGAKVYVYVSHAGDDTKIAYEAIYRGTVNTSTEMKAMEKNGFRPATAVGEKWAFFWRVSDLKRLTKPMPLSSVQLPSGKYLKSYPRWPIQVVN